MARNTIKKGIGINNAALCSCIAQPELAAETARRLIVDTRRRVVGALQVEAACKIKLPTSLDDLPSIYSTAKK
jgi:hypothetical protein